MSPDSFHKTLCQLTNTKKFLLAYSGGLDSHVLLSLMHDVMQAYPEIACRVLHVNHHLNPQADAWAMHCQQICQALALPFLVKDIYIDTDNGDSLEARARQLRYEIFKQQLQEDECLLTAHHLDDQAETLLLQLLRGAGPKGLSAMPVKKLLAQHEFVRPLLDYSRQQLQHYAQQKELQWIDDDSNQDERFHRNYLRHQVMPLLLQRWPAALNNLSRSSQHCAEAAQLMDDLAAIDFDVIKTEDIDCVDLSGLLTLSAERQRNVLRYWFRQLQLQTPSTQQLLRIQQDVLQAQADASPVLQLGEFEVKRYRQQLFIHPMTLSHDPAVAIHWNLTKPLLLPKQGGYLTAKQQKGKGVVLSDSQHAVTVRFRQGGETIKLSGRQGHHSLKKLFQEWGVPPWQRNRIPLIYRETELIAVAGYCVSKMAAAKKDDLGWQIDYHDGQTQVNC